MASFHYRITSSKKGTAAEHVAYITRVGKYRRYQDLLWAGAGNFPAWAANDPAPFWRAADTFERSNGAACREHRVALPNELTLAQQRDLVNSIVEGLVGSKPFQYAVHVPVAALGDGQNTHLHLIHSDRVCDGIERGPEQTFKRYNRQNPAKGGCRKDSGGRNRMQVRNDVIAVRKLIADLQNAALSKHGHEARVDHRTLKAQGKVKQAERHLGPARIRGMAPREREMYRDARLGETKVEPGEPQGASPPLAGKPVE